MGVAPLPLVESLDVFTKQIPKPLQSVNGIEWGDARLTGDILKAFGLTRELRQAFISYKRSDSAGSPSSSPNPVRRTPPRWTWPCAEHDEDGPAGSVGPPRLRMAIVYGAMVVGAVGLFPPH